MKKYIHNLLRIILLAVFASAFSLACKPELTDGNRFALYYPGITDIGPSTNIKVSPTWHGDTPADFAIDGVTLDNESYQTTSFSIDSKSGEVSLHDTENLPVGKYSITVSCKSGDKRYTFKDAITVNMMKPVPDGIRVEPNPLRFSLADARSSESELPTAQIVTEGNHISVTRYIIAGVRLNGTVVEDFSKLFSVSAKGVVSVKNGNTEIKSGEYVLDFKLTTFIVGESSQEGIFENALTIDVTSEPTALSYFAESGRVEAGYAFTSSEPKLEGSRTDLKFTLKSFTPESAPVSIDEKTGVVSVAAGNTLNPGDVISLSISVSNAYGSKDFDDVYKIETVEYVNPISKLVYAPAPEIFENVKFAIDVAECDGDYVTYSFAEPLPEALSSLKINSETGKIYADKGNTIPLGTYTVKVKALNIKGEMTTDVTFTVSKNPYMFTYVRYGNNLNLSPISNYASQFRLDIDAGVTSLVIPVAESDIPQGQPIEWSVKKTFAKGTYEINAESGELKVTAPATIGRWLDIVTVKVKVGGDSPAAVVREVPVFFNFAKVSNNYKILYSPFVFQCNPKKGGRSASPVIVGDGNAPGNFTMDYRRSFNYYNLEGPESHVTGAVNAQGSFLYNLWATYFEAMGKVVNTGSRDPMSYFSGDLIQRLGYVDQNDFAVVINPDKFRDNSGYANGIFVGQIIYGASGGADPAGQFNKNGDFPIAVWLSTDF